MKAIKYVVSFAFVLSTASAQTWSQPVREVEKEARSAVVGFCSQMEIPAGYSGSAVITCTYRSIMPGSSSMDRVPVGKTLVIEDISGSCTKSGSDAFSSLRIDAGGRPKQLPLTLRATYGNGAQAWYSSTPLRMYAPPDSSVTASASLTTNAAQLAQCALNFSGHLVSVQ